MDRKRAASAERTRAKQKRKGERQRAKDTRAGIHVPTEFRRVWRVARRALPGRLPETPARLTLWKKTTGDRSGHAYYSGGKVHLTIADHVGPGVVRGLIVHEIAHPARGRHGGVHDDGFWSVAAEIAEAAYRVEVPVLSGSAYMRQCQLEAALEGAEKKSK